LAIEAPAKLAPVITPPAVTTPDACVAVNPAAPLVVIKPPEVMPAGIAKAVAGVGWTTDAPTKLAPVTVAVALMAPVTAPKAGRAPMPKGNAAAPPPELKLPALTVPVTAPKAGRAPMPEGNIAAPPPGLLV